MTKIYLDHNATTDILPEARKAVLEAMANTHNPSSVHSFGRKAKSIIEGVKQRLLRSLNASSLEYEVIFTSSGTEANNLVIQGINCPQIITSAIEHPSIIEPAKHSNKASLIPVDSSGLINCEQLKHILSSSEKGSLLSIMYANNETGVIQDFNGTICKITKKHNLIFHSDISQAYGKVPIDLTKTKFDLVTLSGHKFGAPHGVAALVKRKNIKLNPIIHGGAQELGYKPGTENVAAIAGFGAAIDKINELNAKYTELAELRNYMEKELVKLSDDILILSEKVTRLPNTSSICFKHVSNDLALIKLDLAGIAVSAGSACSSGKIEPSHVMLALTNNREIASSTIRVSLGLTNTKQEINEFIRLCKNIIQPQEQQYREKIGA